MAVTRFVLINFTLKDLESLIAGDKRAQRLFNVVRLNSQGEC